MSEKDEGRRKGGKGCGPKRDLIVFASL